MDAQGLDIVLTSLTQDFQELDVQTDTKLDAARAVEAELDDLVARINALEQTASLTPTRSSTLSESTQGITSSTPVIHSDWETLRRETQARLVDRGVDLSQVSLDALLDPEQVTRIERQFRGGFSLHTRLDRYDIAAAAIAGFVAGLVDFLVVRVPRDIVYLGENVQKGSPLTRWLHDLQVPADNKLARWFQVSYDKVAEVSSEISGMGGCSHRLHTLGHDPLVGLIIGTIDIMRGGLTAISRDGKIVNLDGIDDTRYDPFTAFVWQMMHLFSDGFTKMGLPAPGWSLLQLFQLGSLGEKRRTVAELARYMYLHGYDSRHFLTMRASVAAVEVVLRGYFWIRRSLDKAYDQNAISTAEVIEANGTDVCSKYRAMALAAHATAAAIDVGKAMLCRGNPLAINYAQWLRFFDAVFRWMQINMCSPSDVLYGHAHTNLIALEQGWASMDVTDPSFPTLV